VHWPLLVAGYRAEEQDPDRLALHRTGKANAERLRRDVQRQFSGRNFERNPFSSLAEAQEKMSLWKEDYNLNRPHLSLGNLTPQKSSMKLKLETKAA
jgi:putative transposase